VNTPPVVTMSGPSTMFRRGQAAFDATASDDDQDPGSLRLEWRTQRMEEGATCPPGDGGLTVDPVQVSTSARFVFTGPAIPGLTCVWVLARDDRQAPAWDGHAVEVKNRAPEAAIDVRKPLPVTGGSYPLYATAQLSAGRSSDPDMDPFTSEWQLTAPDGTTSKPPACPMAPDDACVALDRPGLYRLDLTVSDPYGERAHQQQMLVVAEDHPPCIATTMPDFRIGSGVLPIPQKSSEPLRIELDVVDDDGDPFPPVADRLPSLAWQWHFDDEPTVHRLRSGATLEFPPSFLAPHAGHKLLVSLTYQDRVPRDLSHCPDNEPLCEVPPGDPGAHCYQRVGWTVQID
jgi:hypothetical protein